MTTKAKRVAVAVFGGVLCVIAALVVGRFARGGSDSADPTAFLAGDLSGKRSPADATHPPTDPTRVDLLDLIQPDRDAVAGTWGFQNRALITAHAPWGRLEVPCIPPAEYDLELKVTRKRGVSSLSLGLLIGGVRTMLVLDGEESTKSWLVREATPTAAGNESAASARVFRWNRPTTLKVSVRATTVTVTADGKPILEWHGDVRDLASPPEFLVPDPNSIVLGASETIFRIDEFTLIPVSGSPVVLKKA